MTNQFRMTPPNRDHDDAIGRVDPAVALMTLYMAGELSGPAMQKVAEQFESDPAFRALALPVIDLWSMPARSATGLLPPELRAAPPSLERQQVLMDKLCARLEIAPFSVADLDTDHAEPRHRTNLIWVVITNVGNWVLGLHRAIQVVAVVVLLLIAGVTWLTMTGMRAQREALEGRAPTGWLGSASAVEPRSAPVTVTLGAGAIARVMSGPKTRLTYTSKSTLGRFTTNVSSAALDGTAIFVVYPGWSVVVKTFAATMQLDPGYYAVSCDPACDAVRVRVGAGHVLLHATFGPQADTLSVFSGALVEASMNKKPKLDTDSTGFPSLKEATGLILKH